MGLFPYAGRPPKVIAPVVGTTKSMKVGKAPRVLKGVKAARSKATKITRLWDDLPRNSASTPLPPKYPASGAFPMGVLETVEVWLPDPMAVLTLDHRCFFGNTEFSLGLRTVFLASEPLGNA